MACSLEPASAGFHERLAGALLFQGQSPCCLGLLFVLDQCCGIIPSHTWICCCSVTIAVKRATVPTAAVTTKPLVGMLHYSWWLRCGTGSPGRRLPLLPKAEAVGAPQCSHAGAYVLQYASGFPDDILYLRNVQY